MVHYSPCVLPGQPLTNPWPWDRFQAAAVNHEAQLWLKLCDQTRDNNSPLSQQNTLTCVEKQDSHRSQSQDQKRLEGSRMRGGVRNWRSLTLLMSWFWLDSLHTEASVLQVEQSSALFNPCLDQPDCGSFGHLLKPESAFIWSEIRLLTWCWSISGSSVSSERICHFALFVNGVSVGLGLLLLQNYSQYYLVAGLLLFLLISFIMLHLLG